MTGCCFAINWLMCNAYERMFPDSEAQPLRNGYLTLRIEVRAAILWWNGNKVRTLMVIGVNI